MISILDKDALENIIQEYTRILGISTQYISISLEDLRIGGMKNAKSNLGITGHQNWLKTRSYSRILLRILRGYSLMIKCKKSLQKIDNLGI